MSTKKLLTQEELQQLHEIKQQVISTASALGELEYQKITLEIEHAKLVNQVKAIRETEQAVLTKFSQKYGDGIINLETGEVDIRE